ncbi:TOBE domain-containing protein [Terrisporobacter sp.]
MRLSARNQFCGKVVEISTGAVNSVVKVELPKGGVITSTITNEAVKELELEVGSEATAVIKATSVILSTNPKGLSARNKLTGKVVAINEGAVNSVVKVQLDCEQVLSSTVTVEAVKELELSEGSDVTAIIKATEVMLMA